WWWYWDCSLVGVFCQTELTQSGSMTLQPGQPLTLSCQVSGYSVTSTSYCTGWVRQPAGKVSYSVTKTWTAWIRQLEWIGNVYSGDTQYKDSLKNMLGLSVDSSSNTVFLKGNIQTEDTAVYYCAYPQLITSL
uniref:Ig-like domain-containing protein n=1 Tax=Oncorhynchus tshawytscha TaxID=74940 RepID=A0AAZ3QAV7_ONCTS